MCTDCPRCFNIGTHCVSAAWTASEPNILRNSFLGFKCFLSTDKIPLSITIAAAFASAWLGTV